jgi:hypothetical protein
MLILWKEISLWCIFIGEEIHVTQDRLIIEEECKEYIPKLTTNLEAQGEKEHVKQSIQKFQEMFPPLQVEWPLENKVLATSSRASPQKPHNQERSVQSEY